MDPLTAIGLASNVLGFIDTGTKLCILIKEYSSISGAPKEVVSTMKRLELVLGMIKELDESRRARLDNEKLAMKICSDEAEDLRIFLEGLKIASDVPRANESLFQRLGRNTSKSAEKTWKAFKALRGREKMEMFQTSLHRILDLIQMQQQNRIE
jgi:transposase